MRSNKKNIHKTYLLSFEGIQNNCIVLKGIYDNKSYLKYCHIKEFVLKGINPYSLLSTVLAIDARESKNGKLYNVSYVEIYDLGYVA